MIINVSTEKIAIYGAITATVSLLIGLASVGLQFVQVLRDRKKIKISFSKNNRIYSVGVHNPYKENEDYISIDVINNGRRPVTIISCGAILYTRRRLLPTDMLKLGQFILSEGEKKSILLEQSPVNFKEINYFFAKDATNKIYKKYIDNFLYRIFKICIYFFKSKVG